MLFRVLLVKSWEFWLRCANLQLNVLSCRVFQMLERAADPPLLTLRSQDGLTALINKGR